MADDDDGDDGAVAGEAPEPGVVRDGLTIMSLQGQILEFAIEAYEDAKPEAEPPHMFFALIAAAGTWLARCPDLELREELLEIAASRLPLIVRNGGDFPAKPVLSS